MSNQRGLWGLCINGFENLGPSEGVVMTIHVGLISKYYELLVRIKSPLHAEEEFLGFHPALHLHHQQPLKNIGRIFDPKKGHVRLKWENMRLLGSFLAA